MVSVADSEGISDDFSHKKASNEDEEEENEQMREEVLTTSISNANDDKPRISLSSDNSDNENDQIFIDTNDVVLEEFIKECTDNETLFLSTLHSLLKCVRN